MGSCRWQQQDMSCPRTLSQRTQAEAGMMLDSHVKKGDMLTSMTAHVSG